MKIKAWYNRQEVDLIVENFYPYISFTISEQNFALDRLEILKLFNFLKSLLDNKSVDDDMVTIKDDKAMSLERAKSEISKLYRLGDYICTLGLTDDSRHDILNPIYHRIYDISKDFSISEEELRELEHGKVA